MLAGYETAVAGSGFHALAEIARRAPDLVILDLEMPGMSGLEVCRVVKNNAFTARIPVLMLTAQAGLDHRIEGFEAGADEYLSKPFDPRELTARINALLRLVQREGERNPSSGLPGGRAIESAIARRAAHGEAFAIVYLDLDHFKPFADVFGFGAADAAITAAGQAIAEAVREHNDATPETPPASDGEARGTSPTPDDFAGHIGGDDFLVVTDVERAPQIAQAAAAKFSAAVNRIAGPNAAERGTFEGVDREGRAREFVLAGMSAAIISVAAGAPISIHHLGAFAAETKRYAKAQGAGTILVRAWTG